MSRYRGELGERAGVATGLEIPGLFSAGGGPVVVTGASDVVLLGGGFAGEAEVGTSPSPEEPPPGDIGTSHVSSATITPTAAISCPQRAWAFFASRVFWGPSPPNPQPAGSAPGPPVGSRFARPRLNRRPAASARQQRDDHTHSRKTVAGSRHRGRWLLDGSDTAVSVLPALFARDAVLVTVERGPVAGLSRIERRHPCRPRRRTVRVVRGCRRCWFWRRLRLRHNRLRHDGLRHDGLRCGLHIEPAARRRPEPERRLLGDRLRLPDSRVRPGCRPGHPLARRENRVVTAVGQQQPRTHDLDSLARQRLRREFDRCRRPALAGLGQSENPQLGAVRQSHRATVHNRRHGDRRRCRSRRGGCGRRGRGSRERCGRLRAAHDDHQQGQDRSRHGDHPVLRRLSPVRGCGHGRCIAMPTEDRYRSHPDGPFARRSHRSW